MLAGKGRELDCRHCGGEPLDRVVAGMHLEDEPGFRPDRRREVGQMGAVGRPDLAQPRAGAGHDVGQSKRAADLDQLAARHDRFTPVRQGVQRQHQRPGVVVDRERRLGPGQSGQPARDMVVALAAPAAREVVFERRRVAHRRGGGGDRLFRQRRAAEIGVQHGAGQVEDAALRGLHRAGERGGARFDDRRHRGGRAAQASLGQRLSDRVEDQRPPVSGNQRAGPLGAQDPIDGGQPRTALGHDATAGSGSVCVAPGSRWTLGSPPAARVTNPISAAR